MAKRFKEEEIVKILKEAEEPVNIREVIRKHNISEQSFYRWRQKYGSIYSSRGELISILYPSANMKIRLEWHYLLEVYDGLFYSFPKLLPGVYWYIFHRHYGIFNLFRGLGLSRVAGAME